MIDKKVLGIVVAALVIATPVAVFSDDIQGALNDTITSNNSTNTLDSSNTTTIQNNSTGGTTPMTEETNTGTETPTEETTSQQTSSSVLNDADPTNDWQANPKIRVNPAGHLDKNSPTNRNGTRIA